MFLSVGATLSHRNPSSWDILSYSIPRLFSAEYTRESKNSKNCPSSCKVGKKKKKVTPCVVRVCILGRGGGS